eukprot:COSAG02_NODE_5675_length_4138_cov_3.914088_3_plen_283_part_00
MPRRAAARAATGGKGGSSSTGALPAVADKGDDAAVLAILAKCEVLPSLFVNPALGFKIIWALKHHAARARQRVRAAKKKRKKRLTPKTKAPDGVGLLRSRLQHLGLRMKIIEGDGHCQFRACSDQLYGTQEYHDRVRAIAVEYMHEHGDDFSCFCVEEGAFETYLDQMRKGRRGKPVWGDELTLRAICNALGCTIHVLTSQSGGSQTSWYLKYVPENQTTTKQVFLAYISPVHYNAFELVPTTSKSSGAAATSKDRAAVSTTRKRAGSTCAQKTTTKRTRRR